MSTQYIPEDADDEGVCIRCHRSMHIPSGMDPTPMCCGCAHDALDETAAERNRLQVLVSEMIDLCALGDTDETTDAYGWGDVIKDAKCAIAGKQADHVAAANERLRVLNNTLLTALETAKRIGHLTYVKRGAAFSAAFVAGCDEVDAAIALAREG